MEKNKAQLSEEQFKTRALGEAGVAYSLSAILPVLLSFVLVIALSAVPPEQYQTADWYLYLNYLLPQISFATTAVIYFARSKVSLKRTYCGCKWYYFPLALAVQFGLLFSLNGLNRYFIALLQRMGYQPQSGLLPSLNGWSLLPAILVIALLPALFEETIMRGILSKRMHENGWGTVATVLVTGALFSLFHHNPEQTLYQFCCGMIYTLIALRSGSVFPTVAAHFCNNAVILTLQSVYAERYGESFGFSDLLPKGVYITLMVVSALILAGSLVYLIFFDKRNAQKGGVKKGKLFFLTAAVGILVFAVEWIAMLAMGFGGNG